MTSRNRIISIYYLHAPVVRRFHDSVTVQGYAIHVYFLLIKKQMYKVRKRYLVYSIAGRGGARDRAKLTKSHNIYGERDVQTFRIFNYERYLYFESFFNNRNYSTGIELKH